MDLSTINDLVTLKAIAYDQIAAKEQAINNLNVINQRIAQLQPQGPELPNGQMEIEDEPAKPADGQTALPVNDSAPTDAPADDSTTTTTVAQ